MMNQKLRGQPRSFFYSNIEGPPRFVPPLIKMGIQTKNKKAPPEKAELNASDLQKGFNRHTESQGLGFPPQDLPQLLPEDIFEVFGRLDRRKIRLLEPFQFIQVLQAVDHLFFFFLHRIVNPCVFCLFLIHVTPVRLNTPEDVQHLSRLIRLKMISFT